MLSASLSNDPLQPASQSLMVPDGMPACCRVMIVFPSSSSNVTVTSNSSGHIFPPWQPPGQPLRLAAAHDRLALRWNLRCPEIMGCFMSRVSEGFANIGCAPVSLEGCMHQAEFPGQEAVVIVRIQRPG